MPLRYYNNGVSFTGVQLVDWASDTLTERGRVENTGGVRARLPRGQPLVAVGEMAIVTIDAQDRDKPAGHQAAQAGAPGARCLRRSGRVQVQLVTDVYTDQVRLEVRKFGMEDDGPTLAMLDLPFSCAPFVLRDGDVLHMIGNEPNVGQVVRNADLTDPKNPKLRGRADAHRQQLERLPPGLGLVPHYWSPYAGLPLRNQIVPATFRKVIVEQATAAASGRASCASSTCATSTTPARRQPARCR